LLRRADSGGLAERAETHGRSGDEACALDSNGGLLDQRVQTVAFAQTIDGIAFIKQMVMR